EQAQRRAVDRDNVRVAERPESTALEPRANRSQVIGQRPRAERAARIAPGGPAAAFLAFGHGRILPRCLEADPALRSIAIRTAFESSGKRRTGRACPSKTFSTNWEVLSNPALGTPNPAPTRLLRRSSLEPKGHDSASLVTSMSFAHGPIHFFRLEHERDC